MSQRRRSIERIVALQTTLKTAAAARLAGAEGRQREIAATREALQSFVEGADLTGALAIHAMNATRRLVAEEAAAERRRQTAAEARRKVETALKLAERVGETIARDEQAAAERQALDRLIEETVARNAMPDGS